MKHTFILPILTAALCASFAFASCNKADDAASGEIPPKNEQEINQPGKDEPGQGGTGEDVPAEEDPKKGELTPEEIKVNFEYEISGGKATVAAYTGAMSCVYIPATIESAPVTKIAPAAFYGCNEVTEVKIPESVTEIGDYAFGKCEGLEKISMPESMESIGKSAFEDCSLLTQFTVPYGVKTIDYGFFSGCTRLRKITLPDTLTSVGVGAFAGCASLKEIRIPDGVISIAAGAFSACESLENIELPAGVTAIEAYTFNLCRSFTRFTVPASIDRIDEEAFDGCYSLKEICNLSTLNITAGGKDFGGIARYAAAVYSKDGQTKLSTDKNGYVVYTDGAEKTLVGYLGADPRLVLPEGITAIGDYIFNDNHANTFARERIKSVTIPDSVRKIGESAFNGRDGLKNIDFGKGVKEIGNRAFFGCAGLKSVTLPDGVKTIGANAFESCGNLEEITLGKGVKEIGEYAFSRCGKLTKITLPESLERLGDRTFYECFSLAEIYNFSSVGVETDEYTQVVYTRNEESCVTKDENGFVIYTHGAGKILLDYRGEKSIVEIPDGVTEIKRAFENCKKIVSVTLPESLQTIDSYAFSGCRIWEVYNKSALNIAAGSEENGYVAKYAKNVYTQSGGGKVAEDKNGFITYIDGAEKILIGYCGDKSVPVVPKGVTAVGDRAFEDRSDITGIIFPDSLANVGAYAFRGSGLQTVVIPDGVKTVGDHAFYECEKLRLATIGKGLTRLEDGVFERCFLLKAIYIPENITSIGKAFVHCVSLRVINIPRSVTSIASGAFYSTAALRTVIVDSRNEYYFSSGNCLIEKESKTVLAGGGTKIVIPADGSVTSIDGWAFYNNYLLKSIEIPEAIKTIGRYSFELCFALTDIYFGGTTAEWNAIEKGAGWDNDTGAYVVHCTDGDIQKSEQ